VNRSLSSFTTRRSSDLDAEFAHDAKRQLSGLENQFDKDSAEEPQVQMNIMAPPSGNESLSGGQSQSNNSGSSKKVDSASKTLFRSEEHTSELQSHLNIV